MKEVPGIGGGWIFHVGEGERNKYGVVDVEAGKYG